MIVSHAVIVLACLLAPTEGESRPLDTCVPGDAMAAYMVRPSPDMRTAKPGGTVDQIATWLITLKAMGVIPREARVWADLVGTMPMLARRPHAVVLLDITSKQIHPDVYRLNDMQAALLVDGEGMSVEIERRVRDLLATYTDAQTGSIRALDSGGIRYHELRDERLPAWAVTAWGEVGSQFLVAFGDGAFERMLQTLNGREPALADDSWFRRAHERCRGATSGIEIYVHPNRLRKRLAEVIEHRPLQVLRQVGLHETERLLWTIGFEGRALRSEIMTREISGPEHFAVLTGPNVAAPEVSALIPAEASSYAAFRLPLPDVVRQLRHAYMNSQSRSGQLARREAWARIEQKHGFNTELGLIDQLAEHVVFHTYPPHPLGLPLLCTIWIQHKGDRVTVEHTLNGMMTAWRAQRDKRSEDGPTIGLRPRVDRTEDGLWHLELGLAAPALAVTDEWIVISYSPEAVRANVAYLEGRENGGEGEMER